MTGPELYAKHLAEVANGTPLAASMSRLNGDRVTVDDLFAMIDWELWECIMNLPPMSAAKGEKLESGDAPTTVTDAWHASACAARAAAMLYRLKKLLGREDETPQESPGARQTQHYCPKANAWRDGGAEACEECR